MLVAAIDFEFGFDQSIFFLGGKALLDHQAIYSEIFEFKPPPVFLFTQAPFFVTAPFLLR